MRLNIHIGTTKTGSSSIQSFLSLNRERLRGGGVLVPDSLGAGIHLNAVVASLPFGAAPDLLPTTLRVARGSALSFRLKSAITRRCFGKIPDFAWPTPRVRIRQHAAWRDQIQTAYRDELSHYSDCREAIITAEQLHSRLPLQRDVAEFRDLFCTGFSQTRVIIYVRPQLDQIVSLYSTMLRGGYSHSLADFITSRMKPDFQPYFDLRDVVQRWAAVFGAENIIVRPYKGMTHSAGSLGDFCDLIGVDLTAKGWRYDAHANSSLNEAGQELLLMLNQGHKVHAWHRRRVATWAAKHCGGRGAMPSLALAQEFQSGFKDSNDWVIARYFPDHPEYLEPHWPKS